MSTASVIRTFGELRMMAEQVSRRLDKLEGRTRRRLWTADEEALLRQRYANEDTAQIAADLGRTVDRVYAKAGALGLSKSEAYMEECLQRCGRERAERGKASRFKRGQTPWNKGMKGLQAGGRAKETQFGKGHMPHNWVPVGTEQVRDGYLYRKVTDTRSRRDWKLVHVMLWEQHNGPIPQGMILCFKDGNKRHIELSNLELITRAERMRRNTIHNYPPELRSAIRTVAKLKRTIKEAERDEKQN